MAPTSWLCPTCRRRVPASLDVCRCTTPRVMAEAMPQPLGAAPRARRPPHEPLPADVKILMALIIVIVLGAGARLIFVRDQPRPIVPILGFIERDPPSPSPYSRRRASPAPAAR